MASQTSLLSQFDFHLPKALIAYHPLPKRSGSRLLYLNRVLPTMGAHFHLTQVRPLEHRQFMDFPHLLTPKDLLILNDTQVIPARLYAKKADSEGLVEILVERLLEGDAYKAFVRLKASRSVRKGTVLQLLNGPPSSSHSVTPFSATVDSGQNGQYVLKFNCPLEEIMDAIGEMPLPPYIKRAVLESDKARYQTIYAKNKGAIAAPTAGLHFDEALFQVLHQRGIDIEYITLHVGAGTFQPVRTDIIDAHEMHPEYFSLPERVCHKIIETKQRGGRVIAVGTTTVRALESAAKMSPPNQLKPFEGETRLFIRPGYCFQVVDAMLTNFHLPKSTLLMLVCAFAGYQNTLMAYQSAVTHQYRFFSYGDAMLIS